MMERLWSGLGLSGGNAKVSSPPPSHASARGAEKEGDPATAPLPTTLPYLPHKEEELEVFENGGVGLDYARYGRELLDSFIRIATEDVSRAGSGWRRTKEWGGVVVYERRPPGSGINLLRFETASSVPSPADESASTSVTSTNTNTSGHHVSAETMAALLEDGEWLRRVAPAVFTAKTVLHRFDDNHTVLHFTFPALGPVANRDLTTFETSARNVGGFDYITAARSIRVPSHPPVAGVVRAHVAVTGYGVIRESETSCRLVHILHVNPKGALIPALVNMFHVKPPMEALAAICKHGADYARYRASLSAQLGKAQEAEALPDDIPVPKCPTPAKEKDTSEKTGDSYSHLLERLMDNPKILDQLMNLKPIKRLIKDTALLKSLMHGGEGGKLAEMFDDKAQLEDLCDMIISGELSMQELTDLLNEMFGYETAEGSRNNDKDRMKLIEASFNSELLRFSVLDEHNLLPSSLDISQEADDSSSSTPWTAAPLTAQQENVFQRLLSPHKPTACDQVQQWACDISSLHEPNSEDILSAADIRLMWATLFQCYPSLRILLLRARPGKRRGNSNSSSSAFSRSPSAVGASLYRVLPGQELSFSIRCEDWSAMTIDEQERLWTRFMEEDSLISFDLRKLEYLMRISLVSLGTDRRGAKKMRILWTFHPALLDHTSAAKVFADFTTLLRAQLDKKSTMTSPLPRHTECDTRSILLDGSQADDDEEKRFWGNCLSEMKAPTPLYRTGPNSRATNAMHRMDVEISSDLRRRLLEQSSRHQIPIETLIMAAWSCLLQRCSGGEKRVVFGCLLSGTGQSESHDSVGCIRPILPLAVDLSEDSFQESCERGEGGIGVNVGAFLRRLDSIIAMLKRYQFKSTPMSLASIQQFSDVSTEYNLFESLFVLDDYTDALFPKDSALDERLAIVLRNDTKQTWLYPLVLHVKRSHGGEEHEIKLCYDVGVWSEHDANQLATYLSILLNSLADAQPEQVIQTLPMLPDAEISRLLIDCNSNAQSYPGDMRIEQLFEEQVERTPDKLAITFDELDQQMTYRELNLRSNKMAHYLLSLRLGKGSLIAIYMNRCIDVVVAILGVMKAGAAYLPLDPDTPKERVWTIIGDAGVVAILTQQAKANVLFSNHEDNSCLSICLDEPLVAKAIDALSNSSVPSEIRAELNSDQLCYIIYTSGSTGRPKGVRIRHRGLVNQFYFIRAQPGMRGDDTILGVSTISFDIAQLELVLPLTCGAKIVMVSSSIQRDGFRLKALLEQKLAAKDPITIMQATPASWRMLCAAGWQGDSQHLRIWCGGEAMTCDLARQLLPRCAALWNMYGPTETTVWASAMQVTMEQTEGSSILIGGKEYNSQFFLLDAYRQLVPTGVVGELYIAGDGVGSYVNDEMTERSFVDNPFKRTHLPFSSDKMFRVGDVLRYKDGNTLEFLGRVDHQVKIRGYRIELEEIMNCIYKHSSVKECLVVAKDPDYPSGEKYLVAYIIMKNQQDEDEKQYRAKAVQELRILLEEQLPAYMVPSHFMVLDKWPLSPNGKVDRAALPSPSREGQHEVGFKYSAPNTPTERTLVEVFESILHVSPVGVDDDFFALGGNSLLGVSLIGALEGKFGVRFPFSMIFSASTARHLAVCVDEAVNAETRDGPSEESDFRYPLTDEMGVALDQCADTNEQHKQLLMANNDRSSGTSMVEKMSAAKRLISSFASPLVPLQPAGSGLPLFFIHPAFKSSVCYGALAYLLGVEQPFYGLEPRIEYESIEAMAADYISAIRQVQKNGLYNIGGWSFGCLVAYEVARQLREAGDQVNLLLLDGRAPTFDESYLRYDADALAFCVLCRGAKQYLGFEVDVSYTETAPLSADERLLNVMAKVIDKDGLDLVPPSVAINFFFRFQRDIKHSEVLSRKYKTPDTKLKTRVTLLRTTGDNDIAGVDDPVLHSRTLGWDQFCESVEVVDVGGDHESMVFHPTVQEVAQKLRPCLARE